MEKSYQVLGKSEPVKAHLTFCLATVTRQVCMRAYKCLLPGGKRERLCVNNLKYIYTLR